MRRIVPEHVEKKKQKRNQYIVGFVLIVIMFLSVLGYSSQGNTQENSETITYRGLEFVNQNGLWHIVTDNAQFSFKYHPEQTLDINSTLNKLDNIIITGHFSYKSYPHNNFHPRGPPASFA